MDWQSKGRLGAAKKAHKVICEAAENAGYDLDVIRGEEELAFLGNLEAKIAEILTASFLRERAAMKAIEIAEDRIDQMRTDRDWVLSSLRDAAELLGEGDEEGG